MPNKSRSSQPQGTPFKTLATDTGRPRHAGRLLLAAMALTLAGCASTPDLTLRYFPAVASTVVSVTQTVDCNEAKTVLVSVETVTVGTTYSSDRTKPREIKIKQLSRWYSDSEFKATWFDDGRLKGINQSSTGQGEGIAKAAISLAVMILPLGGADPAADVDQATKDACEAIAEYGKSKPVTLTFATQPIVNGGTKNPELKSSSTIPKKYLDRMRPRLPLLQVQVGTPENLEFTSPADNSKESHVDLKLNRVGISAINVTRDGAEIYKGLVQVPLAEEYALPIPYPAFFGKQGFELLLTDAGGISTLAYNKLSGAAAAIGTAAAMEGTETARANQLKAEADLITQQQRLARCKAQPDKCT